MIYKTMTHWSMDAVLSQIAEKAKLFGFGELNRYEFKPLLKSKGLDLNRDITVVELCNPTAAVKAMDSYPEISAYLPCRISVYEEAGKTVLSTIGIDEMMMAVPEDDEFKTYMTEIFSNVRALMNAW